MRTHRVCLFLAAVMLLLVALPGATAARIVPSNTLHLKQLRHAAAAKITELKAALGHKAKSEVESIRDVFHEWTLKHGKTYDSEEEKELRMRIFADNHVFVARHNAEYEKGEHTHFVGLNHLADLTEDEFKQMLGYDRTLRAPRAPVDASTWEYADVTPPETIDWVAEGAVTPVKNQKQCGSCWAFSTTGAVEGVNAIKTGKLISLSEEELISCSKNGNMGCNGGLMDNGFEWIVNNRGIDTEGEWEYVAKVEKCGFFRRHHRAVAIDGFKDVPTNDEDSLMKAVSKQPVSVAIEADHQSFQLYAGGVYSAKDCGTELDHGVLLVGYGVDPSSKKHKHFWKIKNSWGEAWGEDGYIRIAKGGNGLEGQCGVAMQPSYPTKMGTTPLGEPTLFEKGEELLDKGMDFLQKFAESNGGD